MLNSRVAFDPHPSTSAHEAIGLSGNRETLTIYPSGNDTVTISQERNVSMGNGIVLLPGGPALYFDTRYQGSVVREAWYAIYANGGQPLSFIAGLS